MKHPLQFTFGVANLKRGAMLTSECSSDYGTTQKSQREELFKPAAACLPKICHGCQTG